jgi:hypothetical protein
LWLGRKCLGAKAGIVGQIARGCCGGNDFIVSGFSPARDHFLFDKDFSFFSTYAENGHVTEYRRAVMRKFLAVPWRAATIKFLAHMVVFFQGVIDGLIPDRVSNPVRGVEIMHP